MAAVQTNTVFLQQSDLAGPRYDHIALQFQTAIADVAKTLPQICTTLPAQQRGQCSSDASIGVGYSHSGNGIGASDDGEELNEQDSRGSKRSVELLDCNQTQCGDEDDNDDAKRFKCTNNSRTLTREEKMQRRREGNRRAAQRLRQRRMETVSNLQAEISRLEQERLLYLNHIYQLAASARSVVDENKALRSRLDALQQTPPGAQLEVPDALPAAGLPKALLTQQLARGGSGGRGALGGSCCSSKPSNNAATSRMDFGAMRGDLFTNESEPSVWPFPAL